MSTKNGVRRIDAVTPSPVLKENIQSVVMGAKSLPQILSHILLTDDMSVKLLASAGRRSKSSFKVYPISPWST